MARLRATLLMSVVLPMLMLSSVSAQEPGAQAYKTCAACHLAGGEGVVGAFPPLRNRLTKIASMSGDGSDGRSGGREYLLSVVLRGLNGPIEVDGVSFSGYMQAFEKVYDDEQISSLLNFAVTNLNDEPVSEFKIFSPSEVAEARAKLATANVSSLELRRQLELN